MLPGKRKIIQPATIKGKRQRRFKAKPLYSERETAWGGGAGGGRFID